nr:MFS transporter [Bradyrhizobium manausense]
MRVEPFGLAFIVFRFSRNSYFHVAFSVLYFQSLGFSLATALSLESFYYVAKAGLEVPSGVFADRIGRKMTLVLGSLIAASCYLGLGLCDQYWQMMLFEAGLGLSMSMASGTDSALVYDEYRAIGKIREYERVESAGWGMRNIARGLASAFGSVFAAWYTMGSTFILTSIAIFISAPVAAIFLREGNRKSTTLKGVVLSAVSLVQRNGEYRRVLLQFAIITIGVKAGFWAFQPFSDLHHIPLQWIGACFTALLFVSLVASFFVERICGLFGLLHTQTALIVAAFVIMSLSFASTGVAGIVIVSIGLALHAVAQGISDPIMRILINRYAESESRATAMSVASMAGDGAFSLVAPLFGYLIDKHGGAAGSLAIVLVSLSALYPDLIGRQKMQRKALSS